jgi:hypothetical protein
LFAATPKAVVANQFASAKVLHGVASNLLPNVTFEGNNALIVSYTFHVHYVYIAKAVLGTETAIALVGLFVCCVIY